MNKVMFLLCAAGLAAGAAQASVKPGSSTNGSGVGFEIVLPEDPIEEELGGVGVTSTQLPNPVVSGYVILNEPVGDNPGEVWSDIVFFVPNLPDGSSTVAELWSTVAPLMGTNGAPIGWIDWRGEAHPFVPTQASGVFFMDETIAPDNTAFTDYFADPNLYHIDSVSLPTPGAMALLGLGGLAVARRRR